MAVAPSVAHNVVSAIEVILKRVTTSSLLNSRPEPRLVAISKTKPAEVVREAYDCGLRHFGENYVKELFEKANHPLLCDLENICWHFVGHLQKNKCNQLLSVPNLWIVETVDSTKLATALDNSWRLRKQQKNLSNEQLRVMLQVNTSGEESKHGCLPESALEVVKHIYDSCSQLEFCGLMTIGAANHDYSLGPNPDFATLVKLRSGVCQTFGLEEQNVELSMGMSADFEKAIAAGSTNIRVGKNIFGARQ